MKWKGVQDGTPYHGKSLCDNCTNAHIMKGERVSERMVRCEAIYYDPVRVPFRIVTECSSHRSRTQLSLHAMQKMAYVLKVDPKGKPIGFRQNQEFRKEEGLEKEEYLTHQSD